MPNLGKDAPDMLGQRECNAAWLRRHVRIRVVGLEARGPVLRQREEDGLGVARTQRQPAPRGRDFGHRRIHPQVSVSGTENGSTDSPGGPTCRRFSQKLQTLKFFLGVLHPFLD